MFYHLNNVSSEHQPDFLSREELNSLMPRGVLFSPTIRLYDGIKSLGLSFERAATNKLNQAANKADNEKSFFSDFLKPIFSLACWKAVDKIASKIGPQQYKRTVQSPNSQDQCVVSIDYNMNDPLDGNPNQTSDPECLTVAVSNSQAQHEAKNTVNLIDNNRCYLEISLADGKTSGVVLSLFGINMVRSNPSFSEAARYILRLSQKIGNGEYVDFEAHKQQLSKLDRSDHRDIKMALEKMQAMLETKVDRNPRLIVST